MHRLQALRASSPLVFALALALAAPAVLAAGATAAARPAAAGKAPSTNVAWLPAAGDADVDRAFAQARRENKPVLLYWGATWCPPCNQLKATFFNRQEFATLARGFVAVHVDGDRPGAQRLGQRFAVSGYPSVVVFDAAGKELTRLPGEVDAPQLLAVLQLGLAGGRPVQPVMADALAGKPLTAPEWRLLAYYSWETDEQRLVPKGEVASHLARLAAASAGASPAADADVTTRLWLKALAASDDGKGIKPDAALRERVMKVLADPVASRLHMDVITGSARDMVKVLDGEPGPGRSASSAAFEAALKRLEADGTLSRGDRLGALYARVQLARIDQGREIVNPVMPPALLAEVREMSTRFDREITDGYERQAVITFAGSALGLAGLWSDSEALLKANLAKSHSPYYLMSQLGSNARRQGKKDEALSWFAQAWQKSEGPATRLQWGSGYLSALVDLAPQDGARIEGTARTLFAEAARDKGSFQGRSARSMQRISGKLLEWNKDGSKAAAVARLRKQLDGVCPGVAEEQGQRAACRALLKPAPAAAAAKAA